MSMTMNTQIVKCSPEYTLKYDSKLDELRDRTYQELVLEFGKNEVIKCNCMQREYPITSAWVKSHFNSQKHTHWKTIQQKEHIKQHGHCVNPEQIVDELSKELRQYKKIYSEIKQQTEKKDEKLNIISNKLEELSKENSELNKENSELSKENNELTKENSELKSQLIEKQVDISDDDIFLECNTSENERLEDENHILKEELEKYQKDLIQLTKERDTLKNELFKINKAKKPIKLITRAPFK